MVSKTIKVMKLLICRYGGIGRHHALKMRCSLSVPVQVRLSAPKPNRVKAQRQGGKRKSAMPSLVKSQKPHASHRSAAESRLGFICLGSSEEEHCADNAGVGISKLPLGTTGEGASAFDLFKRRLRFKENGSGYNRQISFYMAPQLRGRARAC